MIFSDSNQEKRNTTFNLLVKLSVFSIVIEKNNDSEKLRKADTA